MTRHIQNLTTLAILGCCCAACDQSNEPPTAASPASATAPTTGGRGDTPQSSLGAAQRSAERTVDKVEQRQQDILKQLEDQEKDQ